MSDEAGIGETARGREHAFRSKVRDRCMKKTRLLTEKRGFVAKDENLLTLAPALI